MLLLNILERQFVIFGLIFMPQDFHLFVLALLSFVVFIVLFTAIFGRIFCGWICPQTVFLEMVFRKIDFWIDGNPSQQKKLASAPWGPAKLFKRIFKHGLFIILSLVICNYFMAYIIGAGRTIEIVTHSPIHHPAGFVAMMVLSLLFYGVFSWFREQACTIVCPYGRLQSVLIDSNTIVVAYDYKRGEPRGKLASGVRSEGNGDCIDCYACLRTCPTGIDIRNGTQLECVNCTACIDACNDIMKKSNRPSGLIRYSSESKLSGEKKKKFNGRLIIYSIILTFLLSLAIGLLGSRSIVEAIILRAPGTLYFESENDAIKNLYTVKLTNKTFKPLSVEFRLKSPAGGKLSLVGNEIVLKPEQITETALFVDIPRQYIFNNSIMIVIEIVVEGKVIDEITTSFMAPGKDISNAGQ